jgi:hypothetical protein
VLLLPPPPSLLPAVLQLLLLKCPAVMLFDDERQLPATKEAKEEQAPHH